MPRGERLDFMEVALLEFGIVKGIEVVKGRRGGRRAGAVRKRASR